MKIFRKITLPKILSVISIFFLASCTATPKINLIKSDDMGMEMELNQSAYRVTSVAFSTHGRYILSAKLGNTFMLWDVTTGRKIREFKGHSSIVWSVAFSPDGRYAMSGSRDGTIKLWEIETGKEVMTLHSGQVTSLLFSSNGRNVLSNNYDNGITKLWDVKTGKEIRQFKANSKVRCIAFSPDGKHVVSGHSDNTVRIWEIATGLEIKKFRGHSGIAGVTSVAFSPDGGYVLSGGADNTVKLWEIATGNAIREFKGPSGFAGYIKALAFSPDGRYLLSGSEDRSIRFWDVSTGKEMRIFKGHSYFVQSVAFSSDGKFVISGGGDASTRLWDSSTGEEVAMMIGFDDGEWLVITREGYYNASEKGAQYLNVLVGERKYDMNLFYDVFYRPDIVVAKLRGEDISGLVTITMQDAIKSPPPIVEFTSNLSDTDQQKVKVCYQVKSTGGGIGEIRLFHNGKLIQSDGYYREVAKSAVEKTQLASLNSKTIYEDMRSVSIKGKADFIPTTSRSKGDIFEDCKDIDAIPGENEVSVTAFNGSNTVQSYMETINFNSKIKPEDPHLYILAVGIDQYKDTNVNLKYAVKDAKDLEEKLKAQSATLYKTENVQYVLLTDKEATKSNITNRIGELVQTIKPQDSFILFVAGHGVLLQNQYYMLTHDYDGMVNDNSMISSNEIVEMSKKIKSLSQLFIFDTCHAGGVDYIVSGLYDARMSVLAKKMGLHIYASANDKQAAMDGYKGNGLFTYVLLDGLNNNKEADKNKDGKVTVVGLGEYSKKMTTNISKEIGHSQTPLIINFGKDSTLYKLQ